MRFRRRKKKLIKFLSILGGFYLLFKFFFFSVLGVVDTDSLIGFSLFFLFYFIYKWGRTFIYGYIWSLSKNLYINFFTLFNLVISLRKLVLGYTKVYMEFFKYNFVALRIVSNCFFENYKILNNNLVNKYLINYYLNNLNLKKNLILNLNNNFKLEYIVRPNFAMELILMMNYDFLIYIL